MVVGSRPEVTEGGQRFRGHRRTDSHDHSYTSPFSGRRGKEKEKKMKESFKPRTKANFYLKLTPLQHIKRWGS